MLSSSWKSVLMSTGAGRFVSARVSRRGGMCVRQLDKDIIPSDGLDCSNTVTVFLARSFLNRNRMRNLLCTEADHTEWCFLVLMGKNWMWNLLCHFKSPKFLNLRASPLYKKHQINRCFTLSTHSRRWVPKWESPPSSSDNGRWMGTFLKQYDTDPLERRVRSRLNARHCYRVSLVYLIMWLLMAGVLCCSPDSARSPHDWLNSTDLIDSLWRCWCCCPYENFFKRL